MTSGPQNDWLAAARTAMEIESESIRSAAARYLSMSTGEMVRMSVWLKARTAPLLTLMLVLPR